MSNNLNQYYQRPEVPNYTIRITSDIFVMIMLAVWTLLNMVQGASADLSADEAYYYVLSQHFSWGYFDHPPMNMWLISLSTFFFGDSELGIRFLTILLQPIYLFLFWKTVKTERSHMRSALTYVLLAFSMPLLQAWGWLSTPDASLMMFSVLLLWAYKKFMDSDQLLYAVLMGVAIALLGYSKYHGVLFLIFLVLSNRVILLSWKFWVGILVASVMFLPHIYWQYSHDWVSFLYHLNGRTNNFEWENLFIYILNITTTFNPFLIIVIIAFIVKGSLPSKNVVARAMKWNMWGFVIFFLISVLKVHVQAQWTILVSFPVIYFIFVASEKNQNLRNYVSKVGCWMLFLFVVVRIFFLIPDSQKLITFDELGSKQKYKEFATKLNSLPFIANSNYQFASKLCYYGNIQTYGRPALDCRSSHYQFLDFENLYRGKTVAVEISQYAKNSNRIGIPFFDTVITKKIIKKVPIYDTSVISRTYHYDTILDNVIVWDTIQNYLPTEKVSIKVSGVPQSIHTDDFILPEFDIFNPYDYDIPIAGPFKYNLYMNVKYGRFSSVEFPIGWTKGQAVIPAKSSYKFRKEIRFPNDIPTGVGTYCFTIQRLPFGSWANSSFGQIKIYNSKNTTIKERHLLLEPYKPPVKEVEKAPSKNVKGGKSESKK